MTILKAPGALNYNKLIFEKIMRSQFVCIMAIALKITFKYFVQLFLLSVTFLFLHALVI